MKFIVPRTCTEIGDDGAEAGTARSADGFAETEDSVWDEIIRREAAAARATEGSDDRSGSPGRADGAPAEPGHSRPLEAFRESAAWVLLGAPGAGKTTVFTEEAKRDGGHYVTARDFLTFDDEPRAARHHPVHRRARREAGGSGGRAHAAG